MDLSKEINVINLLGKVAGSEVSNLANDKLLPKQDLAKAFILSIEKALSDVSDVRVKVRVEDALVKVYARMSCHPVENSFQNLREGYISEDPDSITINDMIQNDDQKIGHPEYLEYLCTYDLNTDLSTFSRSVVRSITDYFRSEIRILEKYREIDIFESKKGEIVSGTVIAFESGNCILNLGSGDGFLSKHDMMPNDFFSVGSQIKAYIYDVQLNMDGYQILLSRTKPEFLIGIMYDMIPELENRSMTVLKAVRDPGMRSKVAVYSDSTIVDPVGCCIGRDGMRIKAIRAEMGNERIDVVSWNEDPAVFIANALYPLEVQKIIFETDASVEIIVSDEDFNKAKAHRHQQVRLASKLTEYKLQLISESNDVERNAQERNAALSDFISLGLTEFESRVLLDNDIAYIDDIAQSSAEDLKSLLSDQYSDDQIQGFIQHASKITAERMQKAYQEANIDILLSAMPYAEQIPIEVLSENCIRSIDDILKLDISEVSNILSQYIDNEILIDVCNEIINWAQERKELQ